MNNRSRVRYSKRFRPKATAAWVDRIFLEQKGELAVYQRMINTGEVNQADARTQLHIRALIDSGVLKDRAFYLNGKETW